MRLNFKIMKLKKNYFVFLLFLCCGIMIIFQPSCTQNDNFVGVDDHSTYLHINIKDNQRFSSHELSVLKESFERVGEYVKNEDGKWGLTITSGKDINMSETLFQFIKEHIELVNRQNEIYALLEEKGIKFEMPKHLILYNSTPRLKLRSQEADDPPRIKNGSEYEYIVGYPYVLERITLDHSVTLQVLNAKQSAASDVSQFATLLGMIPYFTAGAVLVSSMAWLEGKQFSKFEDDYLESGSNRGITMEIWHWDMGNGFPVTTYSVFEN